MDVSEDIKEGLEDYASGKCDLPYAFQVYICGGIGKVLGLEDWEVSGLISRLSRSEPIVREAWGHIHREFENYRLGITEIDDSLKDTSVFVAMILANISPQ
ncbi:MAG: hypothetical protein KKA60_05355 [Proteobacteria bacterium]|nr:hypothetical protein [Pseudomonadota bacterium]